MTSDNVLISKLQRLTALVAAATIETRFKILTNAFKYDPNQPRVPVGSPEGGEWTSTGGGTEGDSLASNQGRDEEVSVQRILAMAPRLAAARTNKDRCIEICSPLLQRIEPRGTTNINYWDFVRCLNACMGK